MRRADDDYRVPIRLVELSEADARLSYLPLDRVHIRALAHMRDSCAVASACLAHVIGAIRAYLKGGEAEINTLIAVARDLIIFGFAVVRVRPMVPPKPAETRSAIELLVAADGGSETPPDAGDTLTGPIRITVVDPRLVLLSVAFDPEVCKNRFCCMFDDNVIPKGVSYAGGVYVTDPSLVVLAAGDLSFDFYNGRAFLSSPLAKVTESYIRMETQAEAIAAAVHRQAVRGTIVVAAKPQAVTERAGVSTHQLLKANMLQYANLHQTRDIPAYGPSMAVREEVVQRDVLERPRFARDVPASLNSVYGRLRLNTQPTVGACINSAQGKHVTKEPITSVVAESVHDGPAIDAYPHQYRDIQTFFAEVCMAFGVDMRDIVGLAVTTRDTHAASGSDARSNLVMHQRIRGLLGVLSGLVVRVDSLHAVTVREVPPRMESVLSVDEAVKLFQSGIIDAEGVLTLSGVNFYVSTGALHSNTAAPVSRVASESNLPTRARKTQPEIAAAAVSPNKSKRGTSGVGNSARPV